MIAALYVLKRVFFGKLYVEKKLFLVCAVLTAGGFLSIFPTVANTDKILVVRDFQE